MSTEIRIQATRGWFRIPWRELWDYRDLFKQLVLRDYSSKYRQTILGPLWFVLQPLMMTAVLTIVFGRLAKLPTDGVPPILFYLCGLLAWNYFAQTLQMVSGTFTSNLNLLEKVYFPRLIIPLSVVTSNLLSFALQFVTFLAVALYYRLVNHYSPVSTLHPMLAALLIAGSQLQIMVLALSVGLIFASATGKYRDLQHILPVLMQLWLYASPVVYPLSMVSLDPRWHFIAILNPMVAPVEGFKLALLGASSWSPSLALISLGMTIALLILGLSIFGKVERTVIDSA